MNHMNQFYQQQHSPLLPRRATEPVTLAPAASMIDPNLEALRIQQLSQLPPNYARLQMQHNSAAIHGQNNGYPTPLHNGNANKGNNNNNGIVSAERVLPAIGVNDSSIDDAYVQFILYCNPSIPLDVDTAELRKVLRNPPKSDGKSFSTFRLFELISRLEINDIKTWTQLVIELGVEKPDAAKNQSSQKVQQYAVRLKVNILFYYLFNFRTAMNSVGRPPYDILVPSEKIERYGFCSESSFPVSVAVICIESLYHSTTAHPPQNVADSLCPTAITFNGIWRRYGISIL